MSDEFEYSIDFSVPPKSNQKDREKVLKLITDSFVVMTKSLALKREAEMNLINILQFCEKYKNVDPDSVEWEEKERIYKEAEGLMEKWREAYEKLKELDKEYEEVRQRVNAHYGKEVMPKRRLYPSNFEKMNEDMFGDDDEADWWKK